MSKPRVSEADCASWYHDRQSLHVGLLKVVESTLAAILQTKAVAAISVGGRVKTLRSLQKKVRQKNYADLSKEVTDLVGVRVMLYTESDVARASEAIAHALKVHADKSGNKADLLGTDRFGYRSVHFICELGPDRIALPELKQYEGLVFEVQVRTILQHAWAEIEHDRSYKIEGGLPDVLERRLALVAGLLEMADRELDAIAREADEHAKTLVNPSKRITTENVQQLIELRARQMQYPLDPPLGRVDQGRAEQGRVEIFQELGGMGITTEKDLDDLFSDAFWSDQRAAESRTTWPGLVRNAMMHKDLRGYFHSVWNNHWTGADYATLAFLKRKYPDEIVSRVVEQAQLHVYDDSDVQRDP